MQVKKKIFNVMLTDAAKRQGAKVVEAEEKIKTWLKYSGDRNGGRKKRAIEKGTQGIFKADPKCY